MGGGLGSRDELGINVLPKVNWEGIVWDKRLGF